MLTVRKLPRKPKHFHNFTGLTPQQFDELLQAVEPLYQQAEDERLFNADRQRAEEALRRAELRASEGGEQVD